MGRSRSRSNRKKHEKDRKKEKKDKKDKKEKKYSKSREKYQEKSEERRPPRAKSPKLTVEEQKKLELKKKQERLAKMKLLKYQDSSSSEDEKKVKNPIINNILPTINSNNNNNSISLNNNNNLLNTLVNTNNLPSIPIPISENFSNEISQIISQKVLQNQIQENQNIQAENNQAQIKKEEVNEQIVQEQPKEEKIEQQTDKMQEEEQEDQQQQGNLQQIQAKQQQESYQQLFLQQQLLQQQQQIQQQQQQQSSLQQCVQILISMNNQNQIPTSEDFQREQLSPQQPAPYDIVDSDGLENDDTENENDQNTYVNSQGNISSNIQYQSINQSINYNHKTINQQQPQVESEEDELDAFYKEIDKQLGIDTHQYQNQQNNEYKQQNYITSEELFGNMGIQYNQYSGNEEDEDAEAEQYYQSIQNQNQNQNQDQNQKQQEQQKLQQDQIMKMEEQEDEQIKNEEDPDYDDDEHLKAFLEAIKKKKEDELIDNRGALMSDEEAALEENQEIEAYENQGEIKEDYLERIKREAQKKNLKQIEYKPEELTPFRKDFYIECKEIRQMSEQEVKQYRENLGDIQVKGADVPKPIKTWTQCGLSDRVLHTLVHKKKYEKPFPIQCQALPVIMSGRDTIGIAETGSGKTLAYLLPMMRHIADQRPLEEGDGPIGLILVPTRELAMQIYLETKPFTKAHNFNIVAIYGGTGIKGQLSELKRGCEIVVATPGRLIDVLTTSNGKITNLRRVTMVVIDEADRMFDLGFEPQLTKILGTTRPDKQTALFSATFPKNVENLAKKLMQHKPVEITVGARGQACTNITQIIEIREEATRLYRLLELLGLYLDKGQVIIFVDKQVEADQLYTNLLKYSYYPTMLHAGMDADDRASNLMDFKKGLYKILIATSVSSRGIDVKNVVLVVNYKCPNHIEDYIHRIGRTGRAGNKGTAVTFLGPDEEQYSADLVKALKRSDQQVPEQLQEMANNYKKKVKIGEVKLYSNQNIQGHGYSFNEQEKINAEKAKIEQQKFINFQLGINDEIDDFAEDKIIKKTQPKTEEDKEKQERKNMMSLQQKLAQIKDKEEYRDLYEQILSESKKAADKALQSGQSSQKIQEAAEEAIRKALEKYRPATKSIDAGKMEIVKMLQDFEKQNEEANNQIVAELEINDYPEYARKQVLKKDFLERIYMLTNCNVVQRGILVESGKKPQAGFQKLYLRIEGEQEFHVKSAYKEIKSVLEEISIKMHEKGINQGRYSIV